MAIKLIGLHGESRSGKDETAKILVEDFGFEQRVMADGIRQILLQLDPLLLDNKGKICSLGSLFTRCNEDWDLVKAESKESVELMIKLGQSCRDILGEEVWLNRVLPPVDYTEKICISDCRQPNEYWAIKERGGQIWKITRPGTEKRGMDGLLAGYQFDAQIDNRGSLTDLRGMVQAAIVTNTKNIEVRNRGTGYGR